MTITNTLVSSVCLFAPPFNSFFLSYGLTSDLLGSFCVPGTRCKDPGVLSHTELTAAYGHKSSEPKDNSDLSGCPECRLGHESQASIYTEDVIKLSKSLCACCPWGRGITVCVRGLEMDEDRYKYTGVEWSGIWSLTWPQPLSLTSED